ncbi:MAG: DUF1573 domain-containing protein [Sedimentisphaerales bacterium]|nr:DUF1573 domain-containing protein [Sedimentisphaerales bacterium]
MRTALQMAFWVFVLTVFFNVIGCQTDKSTSTADLDKSTAPTDLNKSTQTAPKSPQQRMEEIRQQSAGEKPSDRRENAGKLVADKLEHDFGTVEPRAKLQAQFMLKNEGTETIQLDKNIGHSCSCTVPSMKKYTLAPGETVPVSISFTAPGNPGRTSKNLWVTTQAPTLPAKLTMTVTATVKEYIKVTPARLELDFRMKEDQPKTIVVESTDDKPFKVTGFSSANGVIKVNYDPENEAATHTLPLTLDMDKLRQSPTGSLIIRVDHPKTKSINIVYQAAKPFVTYPSVKRFMNAQPGQPQKGDIDIISNYKEHFQLGDVTSRNGLIKVLNINEIENGYKLEIEMTPPEKQTNTRMVRDNLIINIKEHPQDTMDVLCYCIIRQQNK